MRRPRTAGLVDAARPAGENDGARFFRQRRIGFVERHNLAINADLAHATGDQLRHLGAEVENQNGSGHGAINLRALEIV